MVVLKRKESKRRRKTKKRTRREGRKNKWGEIFSTGFLWVVWLCLFFTSDTEIGSRGKKEIR